MWVLSGREEEPLLWVVDHLGRCEGSILHPAGPWLELGAALLTVRSRLGIPSLTSATTQTGSRVKSTFLVGFCLLLLLGRACLLPERALVVGARR